MRERERGIHTCLEVVIQPPERARAREGERERVEREGRVHLAFGISVNKLISFFLISLRPAASGAQSCGEGKKRKAFEL